MEMKKKNPTACSSGLFLPNPLTKASLTPSRTAHDVLLKKKTKNNTKPNQTTTNKPTSPGKYMPDYFCRGFSNAFGHTILSCKVFTTNYQLLLIIFLLLTAEQIHCPILQICAIRPRSATLQHSMPKTRHSKVLTICIPLVTTRLKQSRRR